MNGEGRGRVVLKSAREIGLMQEANAHAAEILAMMCAAAVPGENTLALDAIARREIAARPGVKSAFLGYLGYTATVCVSVNEEIVHGVPRRDKVLREGDIVGIDFGVSYRGYVADTARTVAVGQISAEDAQLVRVTDEALARAIELCTPAYRLSDIGRVVQEHAEAHGYGVVRDFVGHGIGTRMHEEPQVLNYYDGPKPRLRVGMVLAIEPMLTLGTHKVKVLKDGWTAVTADGRNAAHFEHSVAVTEQGPVVLSRWPQPRGQTA